MPPLPRAAEASSALGPARPRVARFLGRQGESCLFVTGRPPKVRHRAGGRRALLNQALDLDLQRGLLRRTTGAHSSFSRCAVRSALPQTHGTFLVGYGRGWVHLSKAGFAYCGHRGSSRVARVFKQDELSFHA